MQLTSCPIHLMLSQWITGRGTEKKTTTYLHAALYHSSEMFTCGPPQTVPDPHEPSCLHQRVTGCWRDVFSPGRCLLAQLQSCERDISVPPPPAATSADFISQLGSITTVKIFEELWEYPLRGDVVSCCVEAPLGVDARLWFQLRVSNSPQRVQAVFKSGGNRCQLS